MTWVVMCRNHYVPTDDWKWGTFTDLFSWAKHFASRDDAVACAQAFEARGYTDVLVKSVRATTAAGAP